MFLWEVTSKGTSKEMEKGNRKGTGIIQDALWQIPAVDTWTRSAGASGGEGGGVFSHPLLPAIPARSCRWGLSEQQGGQSECPKAMDGAATKMDTSHF